VAAKFSVFHRRTSLAAVQDRLADVRGRGSRRLAQRLEEIGIEQNRIDRLRGVDHQGRALRRWTVRTGRYAEYTHDQVLIPFGDRSDAIRGFFAKVSRRWGIFGAYRIRVGISSPKADIFVYHARGIRTRAGIIKRNILGITPKLRSRWLGEIARFVREGPRYRP